MTEVLSRIVERKRREVSQRIPAPIAAEPSSRSLREALGKPGARFIMEVKRKSPSGHVARHDLDRAVAAYAPIADAISVLTDGADFGGSLDDLRRVRTLFDGPILAKDFIVDAAQVSESRLAGADAVLAMLSVLDDRAAQAVFDAAAALSMDVIVEVHDRCELDRALDLGAEIIGINNRDLKTLKTDLAVTERLAPLVPADVLLIAESGIATGADVRRLAPMVDAFLVGSSLMAADNIDRAARSLVFGQVKFCGLTRAEDVEVIAKAGATHAGFVFVPGTPRAVTGVQARPLVELARTRSLIPVGVFRDYAVQDAIDIANDLSLPVIQLHGAGDKDVTALRRSLPGCTEIWNAGGADAQLPEGADRLLFDNGRGGTGTAFDWGTLRVRSDLDRSWLAGGIGPANAAEASRTGVYGLDIGSSVESAPGLKGADKVHAVMAALRPSSRSGI